MGKRWYALYTEQRQELKAAMRVTDRLGFRTYVPLAREWQMEGQWEVPVEVGPLFPRYIFVLLNTKPVECGGDEWGLIVSDHRIPVIDVLRNMVRQPMPIPYKAMRAIRWRERPGYRRKAEPKFKPGDEVQIDVGPFQSFTGLVEGTAKQRVKVLLSIFGRQTPADMHETELHKLSA